MFAFFESLNLKRHIKRKQQEMYMKANQYGMTDPIVVNCSQELDALLNKYQRFQQKSI